MAYTVFISMLETPYPIQSTQEYGRNWFIGVLGSFRIVR
jgi:hypothetical protein